MRLIDARRLGAARGWALAWVFDWAVAPPPGLPDPWLPRRARLLSGALLEIVVGVLFAVAATVAFVNAAPREIAMAVAAVPVTIALYVVSRTMGLEAAAAIAVTVLSVYAFGAVQLSQTGADRAVELPFLVFPMVIATLALCRWLAIVVGAGNLIAATTIVLVNGDAGSGGTGIESIGFLLVAFALLFATTWARDHDRDEIGETRSTVRRLLDSTFERILIHENGQIVEANEPAAVLHGFDSAAALIGRRLEEFTAPGEAPRLLAGVTEGGEQTYEFGLVRAEGTKFVGEIHVKDWLREGWQVPDRLRARHHRGRAESGGWMPTGHDDVHRWRHSPRRPFSTPPSANPDSGALRCRRPGRPGGWRISRGHNPYPGSQLRSDDAERHGPGGSAGLQNRPGRVTHGLLGSTPGPLRQALSRM